MIRLAPIALSALALAACNRDGNDERDRAAGQILPGSASDAMLQTDRLQSEAALARPTLKGEDAGENAGRGAGSGPAADGASPSAPEAPAEPAETGERPPLPAPTASSGPAIDPNVTP